MAKSSKPVYVCGECGYESQKWLGHCPSCSSWNTMVEFNAAPIKSVMPHGTMASAKPLEEISCRDFVRIATGIGELDRALGGGIVPGSVILLGGDPGIGKSTLLMQAASSLAASNTVLYVTGEESASQLKLRAKRLGASGKMLILADTLLPNIEAELSRVNPKILIIDSIQTVYSPDIASVAGSTTQIREATAIFTRFAKAADCAVFIVGHVTKEGSLAGPRMLEHMVDTVLYFEGERHDSYRLLRSVKNRFGSTNEVGVFDMSENGMVEIPDPSELFTTGTRASGCTVTCAIEGSRPLIAEVQALVCQSAFGNPRRMAAGIDTGRLVLLLAVLEKRGGIRLSDKDVYANVTGGQRLNERACDLATALAIASSAADRPLPGNTAVFGEVSLTGEVRRVGRLEKRIQECMRLGYTRFLIPSANNEPSLAASSSNAELIRVHTLREVIQLLFDTSERK